MKANKVVGQTTLRVPGKWSHPGELQERLPPGVCLTSKALILPDGEELTFVPMPPDDQFASIFQSSCRRPARRKEWAAVQGYTLNVGLVGPGGSMQAAVTMLQAGAAIVRAGGAGVFIDNSGLAHGGDDWIEMAEDGGPDAVSFAFVGIVRGSQEIWTVGMHVLGLPDVTMRRADGEADGSETIIELVRYLAASDIPIRDGHVVADEAGPRFQVAFTPGDNLGFHHPMHNRYGRLRLVDVRTIAESN